MNKIGSAKSGPAEIIADDTGRSRSCRNPTVPLSMSRHRFDDFRLVSCQTNTWWHCIPGPSGSFISEVTARPKKMAGQRCEHRMHFIAERYSGETTRPIQKHFSLSRCAVKRPGCEPGLPD